MYEFKFVDSTACVMLKKDSQLIDSVFINKLNYDCGLFSIVDLENVVLQMADDHNINKFTLDDNEFKH